MTHRILVAILVLLVFSSCNREKLEEYNEDFTGTWRNQDSAFSSPGNLLTFTMQIEGRQSSIQWRCNPDGSCEERGEGKVYFSRERSEILIRDQVGGQMIHFQVNREPFLDSDGTWKCVIKNVVMVRE